MPAKTISDAELMERLLELFRTSGFANASLSEIAAATGLGRSSLYHRFPQGKDQMATEVIGHVLARFGNTILGPVAGEGTALQRVVEVGARLREFYADGAKNCLLDVMSVGLVSPVAGERLSSAASGWIDAFASVARSDSSDRRSALARAQDAVAAIEGSLVLARVTGDTATFNRTIDRLPELLGLR